MVRFNLQLFAKKSVNAIAQEVIQDKWGNGATRQQKLTSAGYDYNTVQSKVNSLLGNNSSNKSTKSTKSTKTTTNKTTSNKSTKTNTNTTKLPTIEGVDSSLLSQGMTPFTTSDKTNQIGETRESIYTKGQEFLSTPFELPEGVMDTLSTPFAKSDAFIEAENKLYAQEENIKNGTKFDSLYESNLYDYLNREDFEYDVDNDQLFQQALASAMNSGKTAMQDTIGQASALTGGYGSTYATSAGNQAYNAFIEDAYNNLPQYYKMAMEAYQMEGQEMVNRVNMLGTAAQNEYNRMMDYYKILSGNVDRMWNQETFTWEAGQNQAMNIANVSMDMHRIQGEDIKNAYNMANTEYQTSYGTDYDSWKSMIDTTWKAIDYAYNNAWKQKTYDQTEDHFDRTQGLNEKKYMVSTGDTNMDGVLSDDEKVATGTYKYDEKGNVVKADAVKEGYVLGDDGKQYKEPTSKQKTDALKAFQEGKQAYNEYMNSLPSNIYKDGINEYVNEFKPDWVDDYNQYSSYEISNDTYNGGFLGLPFLQGDDHNDEYSIYDDNGAPTETLTYDDLKKKIEDSNIPDEKKEELIKKLKTMSKK